MEFDAHATFSEARKIQESLRAKINLVPLKSAPKTIAGVDVSSNRFSNVLYAGWIVLTYPELEEIDRSFAQTETEFPYVPGFLSFREIPALLLAFKQLKTKPDVTMVDGQGIAHPRRLGIATHLGLVLGLPTFGCAKSILYGIGDEPAPHAGSSEKLFDGKTKEIIGAKLRTKDRIKPVVVSPGNLITLEESLAITRACTHGYRIPEPARRAHMLVNAFRRGELE